MLLRTCYLSAAQFSKSQVDKTLCTNSIGIFCIAKKICGSSAQILPLAKADVLSADCAQLPQNRQYTKRCALTALNYPALRKTSAGIAQVKAYASNAVRTHLPENKKTQRRPCPIGLRCASARRHSWHARQNMYIRGKNTLEGK